MCCLGERRKRFFFNGKKKNKERKVEAKGRGIHLIKKNEERKVEEKGGNE